MLLYIDPGTGSMLFTILIGIIGAAVYSFRMLFIKLKTRLSGGKAKIQTTAVPFAIFSDDRRYWSIFEPICRELNDRGVDVLYLTASEDDPALECSFKHFKAEFIGRDNKAFSKMNFLNANLVMSTTPGLDVYQWKRSKGVKHYVHMPHAASEIVLYRMFGIDYYDSVLLSGDYQIQDIRSLERIRGLKPKDLIKVGIPYMDEMAARLDKVGKIQSREKTVLVAPSWGPSAILNVYGEEIIEALLETGYNIIVRPHPQSFKSEKDMLDKLMKKFPESDKLQWNSDRDNFEVLRRSDILISDFSGVVFEFALVHDKPVIYTDPNFDVGVYDAWWLDTPLWTTTALPRLGHQLSKENFKNIKSLIDECLEDKRFADGRAEVKAETWAYCGEGAKRAADFIIAKCDELAEKEADR